MRIKHGKILKKILKKKTLNEIMLKIFAYRNGKSYPSS